MHASIRFLTRAAFASLLACAMVPAFALAAQPQDQSPAQPQIVRADSTPVVHPGMGGVDGVIALPSPSNASSISLQSITDASFNGRYYNQLDAVSKQMYDAIYGLVKNGPTVNEVTVKLNAPILMKNVPISLTKEEGTNNVNLDFLDNQPKDVCDNVVVPAYSALIWDHPELSWIVNVGFGTDFNIDFSKIDASRLGESRQDCDLTEITFNMTGAPTDTGNAQDIANAVAKAKQVIDANLNAANSEDAEAKLPKRYREAKAIHDYLAKTVSYNNDAAASGYTGNKRMYQTPYSAFYPTNNGEIQTVCAGYAKAFKVLCDAYGIPCVVVSGFSDVYENKAPESHAWNLVELYGSWYGVDVTWDDQGETGTFYDFFCVGSESVPTHFKALAFSQSHKAGMECVVDGGAKFGFWSLPEMSATDFDVNADYSDNEGGSGAGSNDGTSTGGGTTTVTKPTTPVVPKKISQSISLSKSTFAVKVKKVKKSAQKVTLPAKAKTTVSVKVVKYLSSKAKKALKVSSTGKITVKKGTKKGTYKVKIRLSAPARGSYLAAKTITKTIIIKVK